jgi:hypothetical protein
MQYHRLCMSQSNLAKGTEYLFRLTEPDIKGPTCTSGALSSGSAWIRAVMSWRCGFGAGSVC